MNPGLNLRKVACYPDYTIGAVSLSFGAYLHLRSVSAMRIVLESFINVSRFLNGYGNKVMPVMQERAYQ